MAANGIELDVEAYVQNLKGHAKINRLLFLAQQTNGEVRQEAFKLAIQELQQGDDLHTLSNSLRQAHEAGVCTDILLDESWVEAKDQEIKAKEAALENELKLNKSNYITDSIRLSFQDLGNFHYGKGNLTEALKNYARSKDYCTQTSHVWTCCMNAMRVGLEMKNVQSVMTYASKAESNLDAKSDIKSIAKLNAALGLCNLEIRQFHKAAEKFTKVTGGSSFEWTDVVSPQEIALYGVICGIAYFSRSELKTHIINNVAFREFLECFPEVRELVNDFYNSQYASCFARLSSLEPRIRIDLYLHNSAELLCKAVRNKALVQYTSPFSSVSLPKMAQIFSTTYEALEADIVKLVQKGEIQARIDSGSQILYKKKANVRANAYKAALASGEEYLRTTRALLLRASIQRFDMVSRPRGDRGSGRRKGQMPFHSQGPSIPSLPGMNGDFTFPLEDFGDDLSGPDEDSMEMEDSIMADELHDLEAEAMKF